MTSATERLRALLDERHVMWGNIRNDGSESDFFTEWQFDGVEGHAIATEWSVGNLTVCIAHPMTPEQAVAATLGPGTCREVKIDRYWRGCGECGYVWEFMYGIGKCERPRYCPNCGRKVVE